MQIAGTSSSGFVYSDTGGDGPAVVLLHGVLMNGTLWDDVVDRLRGRYRCIVPEQGSGAMNEHEESINEAERRRLIGERGLSPWELLSTLTDGPTTEGDLRMRMELRVGLAAEGVSGPARVVDCDVPEPVDPEVTEWLGHLAHERLQRLLRMRLSPPDDTSNEDR